MRKLFLLLILSILISSAGYSQRSLELGLFGGGSYYLGDLNPYKHFLQTDLAYGFVGRYNLDSRWAARVGVYMGRVKADDGVTKADLSRSLKFESRILDISAVMELNFLKYVTGSTRDFVTPYIFAGLGFFTFNPKVDGYELRDAGTEGQNIGYDDRKPYKLFSFALPFGFGFKYSVNKRLGFAFEWGLRKTITDYIDDVSTTYYLEGESINPGNLTQVLSDPTLDHSPGDQRGDPKTQDWYAFTGITITYKFNLFRNYRCNDFGIRRKY